MRLMASLRRRRLRRTHARSRPCRDLALKDYAPIPYLVRWIELDIDARAEDTLVAAKLSIRRNSGLQEKDLPLALDRHELEFIHAYTLPRKIEPPL